MDCTYDENISENPFYVQFVKDFKNLLEHCITESWIICVPRIGSLSDRVFTVEDFCAHLLVPSDELPETHYSTLTEKQVSVSNKLLSLQSAQGPPLQSHILFEETFYTEDHMKYIVWCLETPLAPSAAGDHLLTSSEHLSTINNCVDLLWRQAGGRQILDQIDTNVHLFVTQHQELPLAVGPLRDLVGQLYTQCLQAALQNKRLRERTETCKHLMENIKLAVESYMQHLLYHTLFKTLHTCCANRDSQLNKTVQNLSDIQLTDLDIGKDLYGAVPKAKQILSNINNYSTVLEKVICIKKALNAIKKVDNENKTVALLTADDILHVLVFLVIKSGLPNWCSQLTYLKEFHLSGAGAGDETTFLVTTLEAVLHHICSGALAHLTTAPRRTGLTDFVSDAKEQNLEHLFELIKLSHKEEVCAIIERNQKQLSDIQNNNMSSLDTAPDRRSAEEDGDSDSTELCHPLCNCNNCNRKIYKNLLKTSPTVTSRDSRGLTALHVASQLGRDTIVEALLERAARPDAADRELCTPLHHAAARGHQNAVLLLIHSGADMVAANGDKNTPLHLCVNNGHLNCVKALIYYAEHSRKDVNINCMNTDGNTPLHMAAKWGYESIARLLVENGAEPSLQNWSGQSAFDYAHNLRMLQVLKSCVPNLFEYIHISNTDPEPAPKPKNTNVESNSVSQTVENLKRIDKIMKAIVDNDLKLACFYLGIEFGSGDVNMSDASGQTALHCAALCGSADMCRLLLRRRARVDAADRAGRTALHLAAGAGRGAALRALLGAGAELRLRDRRGNTALHEAARRGHVRATEILLAHNPDVTVLNGQDKTARDLARDELHLTIIDLIDKYYENTLKESRYK